MTTPRFPKRFWSKQSHAAGSQEHQVLERRSTAPETSDADVGPASDAASRPGVQTQVQRLIRPRGVFIPENYEPNYAYPLIIWLHEAGRSERDVAEVFPNISTRNYVGLALRGTAPTDGDANAGFGWSASERGCAQLQDELHASVGDLRRDFRINCERIFVAGAGDGGTMAWDLLLSRPEWFAGAAVHGGQFPSRPRPLRRFVDLRGKPLLLAVPSPKVAGRADIANAGRLMHAAGLNVSVRALFDERPPSPSFFRSIDRWIMQVIGGCA